MTIFSEKTLRFYRKQIISASAALLKNKHFHITFKRKDIMTPIKIPAGNVKEIIAENEQIDFMRQQKSTKLKKLTSMEAEKKKDEKYYSKKKEDDLPYKNSSNAAPLQSTTTGEQLFQELKRIREQKSREVYARVNSSKPLGGLTKAEIEELKKIEI